MWGRHGGAVWTSLNSSSSCFSSFSSLFYATCISNHSRSSFLLLMLALTFLFSHKFSFVSFLCPHLHHPHIHSTCLTRLHMFQAGMLMLMLALILLFIRAEWLNFQQSDKFQQLEWRKCNHQIVVYSNGLDHDSVPVCTKLLVQRNDISIKTSIAGVTHFWQCGLYRLSFRWHLLHLLPAFDPYNLNGWLF